MNSKNVAFFLTHDEPGGARNLWEQVSNALSLRGWNTPRFTIYKKELNESNSWKSSISRGLTFFSLPIALINTARELNKHKPAITLSAQPFANVISAIVGALCGVKLRVISHHTPLSTYGNIQRLLDLLIGCTPAVSAIVCVSEGVKLSIKHYPKIYLRKVSVIRNALAPDIDNYISTLKAARQENIFRNKARIVAAGRLAEQKNYPQLISAMKEVNEGDLFILGDGPDRQKLEEQILRDGVDDRVHLMGHMSHKDALRFMAGCDIFVQPSLFEGHSVALLEAAALDLPLVVSDVPTQTDAVRSSNGELCAAIVPIGDVKCLSKTLNLIVSDKSYLNKLKQGSADIASSAGFDRLVDSYIETFTIKSFESKNI